VAEMIESIVPPHQNEVEIGGRWYPYVQIGNQLWLAEDLNNEFTGITIGHADNQATASYYNNDPQYGLYYSGWSLPIIEQNLPTGWRIPTYNDYTILVGYVGGASIAGRELKASTDWISGSGLNTYGLTILPTGRIGDQYNRFDSFGYGRLARLWLNTLYPNSSDANYFMQFTDSDEVNLDSVQMLNFSLKVRLVKDVT
jgi:uncharacterized protein (TIGR02145 family)